MADTEQKRDFFISYNKADRIWAEWIAWHLEEAKYTTVIQAWDFRPGANFVLEMQKATANCERTIAVLSEAFLKSGFTQPEWAAAFAQDPTGENGILLPVRVAKCEPTGLLPQINYIDLLDLSEERAREVLLAGVQRKRAKPKRAPGFPKPTTPPSPAPRFPGSLPPVWNVPERDPNFTGRAARLRELHKALASQRPAALTQAIHGMGGIGKTQLATEYCYRHAAEYEIVWWVRSEDPTQLASDYAALAGELGLQEANAKEQEITIEAVRHWLGQNSGWLLTFDNVEKPGDMKNYLPTVKSGHLLITSRHQRWRGVAAPLRVELWPRRESVDFLFKRTGQRDRKAADEVANELGDLPLALSQAGAYMEETGRSFADYLDLLKSQQQELLKRGTAFSGYELTVATTWEASFQQIEKDSPAAADLLNLCAFLAPDDIPLDIIRDGSEHLPDRLAQAAGDALAWDDAIAALRRYSLVEVPGDALSVHRLVQAVTRDRLSAEDGREWAGAAVVIVNGAFPNDVQTNVDAWPLCARLSPHGLAAAEHAEELEVGQNAAVRLLNDSVTYLHGRAQFTDAREVCERALRIAESYYGGDRPEVAASANNLGAVLRGLGDLAGAKAAFDRALRIDEVAYGPDHPEVATDVNSLGGVLRELGDLAGARVNYERALRIDEVAYGPDHPKVAIRVNNLGIVLRAEGDLAGARAHSERALRIDEKTYGPDHPVVATDASNLGGVLKDLGDLRGARAHYERALEILRRALGDEHPTTVTVRENLEKLGK